MGKTVISDDGRFEWDEEKNEINRKKHGANKNYFCPKSR